MKVPINIDFLEKGETEVFSIVNFLGKIHFIYWMNFVILKLTNFFFFFFFF